MHFNTLTMLAITILMAYFVKRLSSRVGLPIVTGYVLTGIVFGISLLNILQEESLQNLDLVNDFALGLIGFTIGSELRRHVFRELGRSILLIAFFEAFITFILVGGVMMIVDPGKVYQALIFGAVASATAPAATVYVIQQYKAKGPLTSTVMAVVGIDDAIALTIFVFASALARSILQSTHISVLTLLAQSFLEIGLSLCLGLVMGLLFNLLFRRVRFPDDLILGIGAFILFNLGIASYFRLSGLLSVMAFGAAVINLNPMLSNRSNRILENFSPILFACFFIFGGAHLNIALFPKVGWIGFVYLVTRAAGKIGGASAGACVGRAPAVVRRYVGLSLIPQVGVAVALAILVRKEFAQPMYGQAGMDLAVLVINVLLFTTIITEIVGPLLTKWALGKANEKGQGR
ncbi:cation:proton antiporter [bacterium]|nr:cation:proton antiporter [bacterium]